MARHPGRITLALVPTFGIFLLFGMARVEAPVSVIGLLFDQPEHFALAAAFVAVAGPVLLFIRPVELAVARIVAAVPGPHRRRRPGDSGRWSTKRASVGIRPARLIVRVVDDPGAMPAPAPVICCS